MKALVISGGGSKGAFGGGVIEYLTKDLNKKYDVLIGTSTGSLLSPLTAIGKLEKLKEAYTSVNQESIFKVNPFKVKNKNGHIKIGINYWNVLYNITIKGKRTFGDSSNLRNSIKEFMTEEDYAAIKNQGKNVLSCVTNLNLGIVEYKSVFDYNYTDYIEWMMASTSVPPWMSIIEMEGYEYADGGILEHAPIQKAIDLGASEVDVIMHRQEINPLAVEKIRNPFHYIVRTTDLLVNEISNDDVKIGKLKSKEKSVKLNFFYTPRRLTNNSLIFDKEVMLEWWKEGYQSATEQYHKSLVLPKKGKAKVIFDGTK